MTLRSSGHALNTPYWSLESACAGRLTRPRPAPATVTGRARSGHTQYSLRHRSLGDGTDTLGVGWCSMKPSSQRTLKLRSVRVSLGGDWLSCSDWLFCGDWFFCSGWFFRRRFLRGGRFLRGRRFVRGSFGVCRRGLGVGGCLLRLLSLLPLLTAGAGHAVRGRCSVCISRSKQDEGASPRDGGH